MRQCKKCGNTLPFDQFYKHRKTSIDGYREYYDRSCIGCSTKKNTDDAVMLHQRRKVCHTCNEEKDGVAYSINRSKEDGLDIICRECKKTRYDSNKDKILIQKQRFRSTNPEKIIEYKLKNRYGITLNEYTSMLEDQQGKCKICNCPEKKKSHNGSIMRLHVDHCHVTGAVRGLLCSACNSGIGNFRDDVSLLQEAITYLENSHPPQTAAPNQ